MLDHHKDEFDQGVNPLAKARYHELSGLHRVQILKLLCELQLHENSALRESLLDQEKEDGPLVAVFCFVSVVK